MVQLHLPIIPCLIVFEGIDGSGKTTIINLLKEACDQGLFRAIFTREPGGSMVGEKIRKLLLNDADSEEESPLTRLLLFMASRSSNFDKTIKPALKEGSLAISDRLDASTFAFQLWGGECQELKRVFYSLRKEILHDVPVVYIYLRITPEVASMRRAQRQQSMQNFLDTLPEDFHRRVFAGYEEFFGNLQRELSREDNPLHVVHVIDASCSIKDVYAQVFSIVMRAWGSQTP